MFPGVVLPQEMSLVQNGGCPKEEDLYPLDVGMVALVQDSLMEPRSNDGAGMKVVLREWWMWRQICPDPKNGDGALRKQNFEQGLNRQILGA